MKTRLGGGRALMMAALMGSTALAAMAASADPARAQAQEAAFDIGPQPLGAALAAYSRATGVNVVYGGTMPGARSPGAVGRMSSSEGLSRILAGSGLTYRFTGAQTVQLEPAPQRAAGEGVIQLGAVRVEGDSGNGGVVAGNGRAAGWDGSGGSVYVTPGSVSVITRDKLEAYPAQAPADMLRGATGIISGEARSSGGLDVNIRGMQGQGRVPVTVDGAINGTTVYRGYQGTSNRSFIDPDFISHVAIEKGPSMGNAIAGGIGGSASTTSCLRTMSWPCG
ncbi:STN domain-containing protein [Brevundimonas diminuta]|uniref:STN domain-containing protein n=1 Tax=Brevundimonas diminuta TaxID=293 RepID=UPI00320AE093